jgi:hypothetical protein
MALIFAGLAAGPTLGALLIDWTGTVLAPFYIALALHATHLIGIAVLLPESRSPEMLRSSQERYENEIKQAAEGETPSLFARAKKNAVNVLVPLTVFMPRRTEVIPDDQLAILRPIVKRSYALTMVGISYSLGASIMGIYSVKMVRVQALPSHRM